MQKFIASAVLALSATTAFAAPADTDAVEKAKQAAQNWLALVDSSQYAATWEQAAQPFKSAVTKPDWEKAAGSVRTPVGKMEQRVLASAAYTENLPGAPAGQYVVIQYKTQFSKKSAAVETVTPMKGADGVWRVTGYYLN